MSARARGQGRCRAAALCGVAGCALAALLLSGCAPRRPFPARPAPESLPAESPLRSGTLAEPDAWLRHYLFVGQAGVAMQALQPKSPLAPRDRLLRALQEGLLLHEAGEYRRSNDALEWAEGEADRRYTRSLSREAAAFLINDGVVSYGPPASELVMVPYYRMLNYLALGDTDAARVEASKANALVARLDRKPADGCHGVGMVLYLAGMVQEAGGEMNDALVSLRQAHRAYESCASTDAESMLAGDLHRLARRAGETELADSVAVRYGLHRDGPSAGGDLLLLVEHGFVAHRSEQALHVPIMPYDLEGLQSGNADGIASAAARVTTRLLDDAWEGEARGRSRSDSPLVQWAHSLEGVHILRLAWPALRLEAARPAQVRVWVNGSLVNAAPAGDLSAAMHGELEARRAATLARMVARGMAKYLISREMEERTEEKGGEAAAFVVGRLANLAANRLEQADLRSWSLLPDRISMVRARLPEGVHHVRIEAVGRDGRITATRDLGEVTIRVGETVVLGERVWGGEMGELPLPAPPGYAPAEAAAVP